MKGRQFLFSRPLVLILLGTLSMCMTGCSGFKVVRIPIPIPTFGIGERHAEQKKPEAPVQESTVSVEKTVEVGQASWYGRKFHGKKTASGETYSMYSMTAAHPTLPFNSQVKVTNLENGNVVYLRINDRGPFVKGRVIDVSRAAARKLGFEMKGIAQVQVESL